MKHVTVPLLPILLSSLFRLLPGRFIVLVVLFKVVLFFASPYFPLTPEIVSRETISGGMWLNCWGTFAPVVTGDADAFAHGQNFGDVAQGDTVSNSRRVQLLVKMGLRRIRQRRSMRGGELFLRKFAGPVWSSAADQAA